jgi:hypothetical protein
MCTTHVLLIMFASIHHGCNSCRDDRIAYLPITFVLCANFWITCEEFSRKGVDGAVGLTEALDCALVPDTKLRNMNHYETAGNSKTILPNMRNAHLLYLRWYMARWAHLWGILGLNIYVMGSELGSSTLPEVLQSNREVWRVKSYNLHNLRALVVMAMSGGLHSEPLQSVKPVWMWDVAAWGQHAKQMASLANLLPTHEDLNGGVSAYTFNATNPLPLASWMGRVHGPSADLIPNSEETGMVHVRLGILPSLHVDPCNLLIGPERRCCDADSLVH